VLTILLEGNSVSQAAALAARITGLKKNTLYELALKMQTANEQNNQ
jgi:16S rRNA (cytidine1402-2'-O)-methyltransferase